VLAQLLQRLILLRAVFWSSGSPGVATIVCGTGIITGVTTGSAVITYSMGVGCTAIRNITVNPLPSAITGVSHVCLGSSTLLSDASARRCMEQQ
jgi:hypothetical protein